jgi:hypothetical protein
MKEKTLTNAGIAIIVILLMTSTIAFISNSKNKHNFNEEKSQNAALTSQKVEVSQELNKVKGDLAALKTKEETSEKALTDVASKLVGKENRIAYISKENSSLLKNKEELAQLQKSHSDLEKVYEDLKLKNETAKARINELENSAIVLDAEKKELSGNLANAQMYRTDNIELYGSRGNKKDKLTICARRTKKLNLNFEVPQNLTEAISFKIITPSGTTVAPEDKSLSWIDVPDSHNFTASLSYGTVDFGVPRIVKLTYTPKEKLAPGEYKIQILSADKIVGNCRIKLR